LGAVLSPMRPTLLLVLLAGTVAGGAPWWWHRRIRSRVEAGVAAWRADLEQHEQGSSVGRPRFDAAGGVTIPWTLAGGRTIEDVRPAVGRLESLLDLRPGAIEIEQDETRKRQVVLRISPHDPHKAARLYAGPPRDASILKVCVIARYVDGGDAGLVLVGVQVLVAGTTGSGKSNVVNIIVWYLAACRDVVLGGCDLKGGVELGPWEDVFAPGWLAHTPERAVEVLEAAVRVITWREGWMRQERLRAWPTSPQRPALVIVIDEIQAVSANKRAIAAIKTITAQGRAMAVSVVIATQYPTVDALGGPKDGALIAANMTASVCLRVKSPTHTNVAFGPGAVSDGWLPHKIPASKPGALYLRAASAEEPRLARSDQVTDQMVARASRELAPYRVALDEGSEHGALGTASSTADSTRAWPADGPPHGPLGGPRFGTAGGPGVGTATVPPDGTALGETDSPPYGTADGPPADPLEALLAVLATAGERGIRAEDLADAIGRGRTWTYDRLGELERQGRARRGLDRRWRLTPQEGGLRTP
ncbi:MAG TPA: FtsK/SpoIIIE domain-containing protein, partial [Streptosporangiaceae bacterium]